LSLEDEIARLRRENAALKAGASSSLSPATTAANDLKGPGPSSMKSLEPQARPDDQASQGAAIRTVLYFSCVAALGGLLFGYDSAELSVINGAVGAICTHFNADPATLGLAVSSALVGAAIGALFIGRVADNFG
jgi:hypothetical protein